MYTKIHHIKPILMSGFFLLFDQLLKRYSISHPENTFYIWKSWIGWEYFPNPGIAFGIPFPQQLLVILTPVIIILLVLWWIQSKQDKRHTIYMYYGIALIIGGALSNLIDRTLFSITIDYFRVFTSIFNMADVMIVLGTTLLLFQATNKKVKIG